ncbi:MAG TPA: conjugative transfer signal peptidase TraF [Rhodocyclaceae bacterium]|nr:conjugative transfer signal peptidase TraF [Rhodocyclaceae bacterium]
MTIQWRRAAIIVVTVAIPVLMLAAAYVAGYRLNLTPSYPLGLWRIEALNRPIAVGDLVFICPPHTPGFEQARERGYVRRGSCPGWLGPLIKTVVALPGQHIEIAVSVTIDGDGLPHSDVQPTDAEGRMLAPYSGGGVPAGTLFLHSDFAGSYDSRYFGPIPASGLLGLARPVFIYGH